MQTARQNGLAPTLPYITWWLIQDPQNKRGIPKFLQTNIINIEQNISAQKKEDVSTTIFVNVKYNKKKKR